jgi:hypothetical protein
MFLGPFLFSWDPSLEKRFDPLEEVEGFMIGQVPGP